jgi:uncharacterized C2H2 Zn-finger protein
MCDVCGKGFNSGSRFKTHMLKHKGLKSFKCEYCNKGFYSNCNLNQHLVVHETGGQYMCHICGKEFKRPFNLKLHMATHTGEKKYQCDTCGQIFSRSDNLMTHSRKHSEKLVPRRFGLERLHCKVIYICNKHIYGTMYLHTCMLNLAQKTFKILIITCAVVNFQFCAFF